MANSTDRILVLADIDDLNVKLGDVLEENDSGKYFVLNRESNGNRPFIVRPVLKEYTVTISPKLFDDHKKELIKLQLDDQKVFDITGLRGTYRTHPDEYIAFLKSTYVKKPNNSRCVVSGGRKRTARRKHPRRKNRRRSTTRK